MSNSTTNLNIYNDNYENMSYTNYSTTDGYKNVDCL